MILPLTQFTQSGIQTDGEDAMAACSLAHTIRPMLNSHRFQVGAGDFLLLGVVCHSLEVRGPAVMFTGLFCWFPSAVFFGFEVQIDISLRRHVGSCEVGRAGTK